MYTIIKPTFLEDIYYNKKKSDILYILVNIFKREYYKK